MSSVRDADHCSDDDAKHRDSDSDAGSDPSSYNSGDYGSVARSGFTRMYVLSYTDQCPTDTSEDYRSAFVVDDDDHWRDDRTWQRGEAKYVGGSDQDSSASVPEPCFQLLYASGSHYFHGAIELPDSLGLEPTTASADSIAESAQRQDLPLSIDVADLSVLLPHFQEQQDTLVAVERITDFRSEVRDVLYQMEEVGAFLVEELAKDKNVARIEQAAQELSWITAPLPGASSLGADVNTTFFELETHADANVDLEDAGVVLIVMKIVVRDVLLDVVYCRDSYFVALRDASRSELALEDAFVPNVECVGPCFVVRSYNDDDIKRLVLWSALPVRSISDGLVVEGTAVDASMSVALPLQAPLPRVASAKVAPVRSARAILDANDTQLYCLLSPSSSSVSRKTERARQKQRRKHQSNRDDDRGDEEKAARHERVVFQFNQYVYEGEVWLDALLLDDLAKLSTRVFPHLRSQSHALAFVGEADDLPLVSTCRGDAQDASDAKDTRADDTPTRALARFAAVREQFAALAPTLLTLVIDAQAWIQDFFAEVDAIVATEDSTPSFASSTALSSASAVSSAWLAMHLKAWLEAHDGNEAFFELELGSCCPLTATLRSSVNTRGDDDDASAGARAIDLLVWQGIVHAAVMVVVYHCDSFYMVLRDVEATDASTSLATQQHDARELFRAIPALGSKGRGYLVRTFADEAPQPWLAGAKLLLWQTSASLAREEAMEARARAAHRGDASRCDGDEQALCADWFIEGEVASEAESSGAQAKAANIAHAQVRGAQRTDDDDKDAQASDAKSTRAPVPTAKAKSSAMHGDKAGRRHHIPPLNAPRSAAPPTTAPWDLRTGRPL